MHSGESSLPSMVLLLRALTSGVASPVGVFHQSSRNYRVGMPMFSGDALACLRGSSLLGGDVSAVDCGKEFQLWIQRFAGIALAPWWAVP